MAKKMKGSPPENPHPKMSPKGPKHPKDKQDKQAPLSGAMKCPPSKQGMGY